MLCGITAPLIGAPLLPLADVHLHFSWDQKELLSAREAVARLHEQNVVLGVVSSTPPELALELRQAGGDWIIPFYRPYLPGSGKHRWYLDPRSLPATRAALESGAYYGLGELHLTAGVGPSAGNAVLNGLLEMAAEFDVPVQIHTEASDHRYFLPICQRHRQVRFLWAHAGGRLNAPQVAALMAACPNVWTELSARDPDRYIDDPIADHDGHLLPQWRQLVARYPDRFMIGSDPAWPVEYLHHWDQADQGWDRVADFLAFHRGWLADLPPELAVAIRLDNARRFLRATPRSP